MLQHFEYKDLKLNSPQYELQDEQKLFLTIDNKIRRSNKNKNAIFQIDVMKAYILNKVVSTIKLLIWI